MYFSENLNAASRRCKFIIGVYVGKTLSTDYFLILFGGGVPISKNLLHQQNVVGQLSAILMIYSDLLNGVNETPS